MQQVADRNKSTDCRRFTASGHPAGRKSCGYSVGTRECREQAVSASETTNMLQINPLGLGCQTGAGNEYLVLDPSSVSVSRTDRISRLVGEIYDDAPEKLRTRLLEHLLRPVSPYTLIAIPGAGGLFAQIRGRNAEWQGFRVEPADIAKVGVRDVTALVDWLQRLRADSIPGLVALVKASPALAECPAASAFVAMHDPQLQA